MPFPTNPALEAAVIADCENDLPRLVYADWLDENGDPARAAFIRTQIALHDKHPADADYPDLLEARREAFDAMHARFDLEPKLPRGVGFYDDFHDPDSDGLLLPPRGFHRGFPHVAHLRDGVLTDGRKANAVRDALPKVLATSTVRGLFSDENPPAELHRILNAPECERLTAFGLDTRNTFRAHSGEVTAVTNSPMAGSLRHLALSPHGDGDVLYLGDAGFPHLRRWECRRGFDCDPRTAEMLFAAGWFGRLRRLLCSIDTGEATAFWAACAANRSLHTLELVGAETGAFLPLSKTKAFRGLGRLDIDFDTEYRADADIAALVRAKLPKLRAFKFTGGALRHDTHKELFAADWFARLRVLELESGYLDDRGVIALGKSAVAARLRSLTLGALVVSPKALLTLAENFPRLTTLDLSVRTYFPRARSSDVRAFLKGLAMPHLRHLRLSLQGAGDPPVAVALGENPSLARLTRLTLDGTGVGDRGLRAIATSPYLQRLSRLDLAWTLVKDGAEVLADPAVLPNLTFCWLPQEVSKKVMSKLRNARGDIFHDWQR